MPPYIELRAEPEQANRAFGGAFYWILWRYGVDILIDYRAASTDQFDGISEMIAVVGVEINFVEEGDCSTYKTSRTV